MSTTTTPDLITVWTTTDPSSIVAESATQATSIQAAFNKRQNYSYRWLNAGARGLQTGMLYGSHGFQADTGEEYFYDGSAWKLWDKPITSFTPTITNTNIGTTGTNTARWSVSSGRAFVEGELVLGGTGINVTDPILSTPVTSNATGVLPPRGMVTLYDLSATQSYPGVIVQPTTTTARLITQNAAGTYVINNSVQPTVPFTWAAGDRMEYSYSFIPA